MKPRILPLLLGVLILYSSCSHGNPTVSRSLDRIESLVEEHRDSALLELVRLDSLIESGTVRIEGERQQARYALLKTQTNDKNYIDDTSDSLIQTAVRYYDEHGDEHEQMLAYFYLGAIHRNAKDLGAAFVAYRHAEALALELGNDHYLSLIYGNLSTLSAESNSGDAVEYSWKNLQYARRSGDRREALQAMADLATTYSVRMEYDSAELYYRQVLDSLPSSDPIVQSCLTSYIEQCVSTGRYQLADSLLGFLCRITLPANLLNKALLYQLHGDCDSTDTYVHRAEKAIRTCEDSVFYYEKLSTIAHLRNDYEAAFTFKRKRIEVHNRIMTALLSKSVSDFHQSFEQQQKELVQYRYDRYRRNTIFASICCAMFAICCSIYLYRLFRSRNRELDAAIRRSVEQGIELERSEMTLGDLRTRIETMEQKLGEARTVTHVERLSRLFANRFNLYNRLGYVLFKTQGKLRRQQTICELVDTEIKRLYSDKKSIEEMDQIIDQSFDGAMTKAKSVELDLNENEIRLLRLMMIRLSSQTIAYLFDINSDAVYKRKYRLKDKLKNNDSPYAREILSELSNEEEEEL